MQIGGFVNGTASFTVSATRGSKTSTYPQNKLEHDAVDLKMVLAIKQ